MAGDKALLQFRSGNVKSSHVWSVPGGAVKGTDGDYDSKQLKSYKPVSFREAFESAIKEFKEEGLKKIGIDFKKEGWKDKYINMLDYFRYTTFVVEVPEKTAKNMEFHKNWEVDGWKWFDKNDLPANVHPGFKDMIESKFGKKLGLKINPKKKVEPND